jgi:hypothetical protein
VSVARRGWLEAGDVLDTLPLEGLARRLAHVRPARARFGGSG